MKLYPLTYIDDAEGDEHYGRTCRWFGTQDALRRAAKQAHSDGMRDIQPAGVHPEPAEVPTDKPNLLAWLNERNVQP